MNDVNPWLMPSKKKGEATAKVTYNYNPSLIQALTEMSQAETRLVGRKISIPTIMRTFCLVSNPAITVKRSQLIARIKQIEKEKKNVTKKYLDIKPGKIQF